MREDFEVVDSYSYLGNFEQVRQRLVVLRSEVDKLIAAARAGSYLKDSHSLVSVHMTAVVVLNSVD